MAKIFLTGASGNVGRPVLAELLSRGHEVTALVHKDRDLKGCRVIQAKLSEAGKYAAEAAASGAVIHLASTMSTDRNPAVNEDILGTGHLLDSWRKGNFIYASTHRVYDVSPGLLTEGTPLSPTCWYDISKICCENQLAIEPRRPGRGVGISFRLALLFSPGRSRRGDQFLENIYAHCERGHTFAFASEEGLETAGSSFVGPGDLARAIADSLELGTAGAYNISSGFCTWRGLIEAMGRKGGFTPKFSLLTGLPKGAQYVRMPQGRSCIDTSLFSGRTGFAPRQDLEELVDGFIRNQA